VEPVTLKKPCLFHADFNHDFKHDFNHEFLHSGTWLADFSQDFNHVEHPFYTLNNKKILLKRNNAKSLKTHNSVI